MNPEISFILTVFNKEKDLPTALQSILCQANKFTDKFDCEYIFVDDASTDNSIKVIKETFKDLTNFTIIANKENLGPTIRLNQGCKAASGKYLFLIDADDILAQNALDLMLNYIKTENADFVFGGSKVLDQEKQSLLNIELPDTTRGEISLNPLDTILSGRYVRMSYLVTKKLYLESGGANEKIFVQDESLPLSLAYHAKKMITLTKAAVYSAKNNSSLSGNKLQLIHDRFYAYYHALSELKELDNNQKNLMYKRAISSIWKAKRISNRLIDRLFFITYLRTKLFSSNKAQAQSLDQYKNFMDNLKNVRKIY
jgi:glycosyltransferase involved in cell wall biosynthesis